jgi:hypothetical protein
MLDNQPHLAHKNTPQTQSRRASSEESETFSFKAALENLSTDRNHHGSRKIQECRWAREQVWCSSVDYELLLINHSLMNDRFGKGKGSDRKKVTSAGIHRINHATGETVDFLQRQIVAED